MKTSKKPSKRHVSDFSEWQWDPDSGQWYRYRYDKNGQVEYEYNQQEVPRTESVDTTGHAEPLTEPYMGSEDYGDDETSSYTHAASQGAHGYGPDETEQDPAAGVEDTAGSVPDVIPGMQNLTVEDYDEEDSYRQDPDAQSATGSSSKGKSSDKKSSKRDDKKHSSSKTKKDGKASGDKKGKGKGKEKETPHHGEPHDPFYDTSQHQSTQQQQHRAHRQSRAHGKQAAPAGGAGGTPSTDPQPVDSGYGYGHAGSTGPMDPEPQYYQAGGDAEGVVYHGGPGVQDEIDMPGDTSNSEAPTDAIYDSSMPPPEEDQEYEFQKAVEESKAAYGGPLGHGDPYAIAYSQPESSYAQEDYERVQEDDDDGSVTPTRAASPGADYHIRGTQGISEPIDPRYRVEPSWKFQPGEVFKVLWSEPQGQLRDNSARKVNLETYTERMEGEDDWGKRFYIGFRRFIVVANDEGHCTCVPILTYIRKGCKKKGVKPAKHGIVHEYSVKPRLLEGEPKLGFKPVRMEIRATGERLARESRVNYSKLVTVEHNVKVFFIGNIYSDDFDNIVRNAVDTCWHEKTHKRSKGSSK